MKTYTIENIQPYIIFKAVMGSHAYGTATPESDIDIRGVFVQPLEDILKYGFVEQVSDENNDITYYEIGRFIKLLIGNNPNITEMLSVPTDCVQYRDHLFKILEDNKEKFLTKRVRWSFAGYAIDQIQKAKGYNKKINWEEKEMKRKSVLDFCYVLVDGGTTLFKNIFSNQKNYGLAAVDHAHNLYAMYYLENSGIVSDETKSNDVQLVSIPKGIPLTSYLSFNKDAYSLHCKKWKEYQTWLKERNENRFKMNKAHGKNYDSKNLMHCMRFLDMVIEMLDYGQIIVRRPKEHVEVLMSIRRGEMEYDDILKIAEEKISLLDEKCKQSKLPENVNVEFAKDILLNIRKTFYNL